MDSKLGCYSKSGGRRALAKALGIKSPSISGWYDRGKVPVERVLAIETATGVSRHDLRPDVFGPSPASPTGEVADAA
nr:YdaS family helix-turn-helix protein [Xanthomonas arboricola]MDN0202824.1 YdaS family helix-turn-helix protein [Xanthomonas arboricola pv. corylina]